MHVLWRGDIQQRLRLISGLILFAFALTHFLTPALGLSSGGLMHDVQESRCVVTRSLPGTVILASALAIHIALGLYKLANRTTLKMPLWEFVQILFGITIPFLLL